MTPDNHPPSAMPRMVAMITSITRNIMNHPSLIINMGSNDAVILQHHIDACTIIEVVKRAVIDGKPKVPSAWEAYREVGDRERNFHRAREE